MIERANRRTNERDTYQLCVYELDELTSTTAAGGSNHERECSKQQLVLILEIEGVQYK